MQNLKIIYFLWQEKKFSQNVNIFCWCPQGSLYLCIATSFLKDVSLFVIEGIFNMPRCTITEMPSMKNSIVFGEYYKLTSLAILCGLFDGQDLWALFQYSFPWQRWIHSKICTYIYDLHLYLSVSKPNGKFCFMISFYMEFKSRALVIWLIMLVPVNKNWLNPLSIADLDEAKGGTSWDIKGHQMTLEKHWIQIVLQAIPENFHERDTILSISKCHNSFYDNSGAQR